MNIKALLILVLLLLPVLAFSQTAAEMDTLLGADIVSVSKAARFIMGAAELIPAGLTGAEAEKAAYDMASSKGWIKAAAGEAITQKDTAFLIMKAFDLKGGIMYSLLKNPRYAYREMLYRKIIQGDQAMKVSGGKLLLILDRTMRYTDGGME